MRHPGLPSIVLAAALLLGACGGGANPAAGGVPTMASEATVAPTTGAAQPSVTRTSTAGATPARAGTSAPSTSAPATAAATATRGTPRAAGTASPAAPPVSFDAAPWGPGERTVYAIQASDTGQQAGQATYVLGREFDADSLSASVTIGQTVDRFQLGFDTKTFRPASEIRNISTAQGTFDIRAEFHEGGATVEVTSAGGVQRAELVLPPVYFANDQFLLLLRALPFKENYRGFLTLVPSQGNPPTIATVVTVTGQETVSTPLGPLRAWKVEADFEGAKQTLWYGVDAPHYLVKYDSGKYVYVMSQAPGR